MRNFTQLLVEIKNDRQGKLSGRRVLAERVSGKIGHSAVRVLLPEAAWQRKTSPSTRLKIWSAKWRGAEIRGNDQLGERRRLF